MPEQLDCRATTTAATSAGWVMGADDAGRPQRFAGGSHADRHSGTPSFSGGGTAQSTLETVLGNGARREERGF